MQLLQNCYTAHSMEIKRCQTCAERHGLFLEQPMAQGDYCEVTALKNGVCHSVSRCVSRLAYKDTGKPNNPYVSWGKIVVTKRAKLDPRVSMAGVNY